MANTNETKEKVFFSFSHSPHILFDFLLFFLFLSRHSMMIKIRGLALLPSLLNDDKNELQTTSSKQWRWRWRSFPIEFSSLISMIRNLFIDHFIVSPSEQYRSNEIFLWRETPVLLSISMDQTHEIIHRLLPQLHLTKDRSIVLSLILIFDRREMSPSLSRFSFRWRWRRRREIILSLSLVLCVIVFIILVLPQHVFFSSSLIWQNTNDDFFLFFQDEEEEEEKKFFSAIFFSSKNWFNELIAHCLWWWEKREWNERKGNRSFNSFCSQISFSRDLSRKNGQCLFESLTCSIDRRMNLRRLFSLVEHVIWSFLSISFWTMTKERQRSIQSNENRLDPSL